MLLLGHRGAKLYQPENTFAAFDAALGHGCDGFECDVRGTRDGHAILWHDEDVNGVPLAVSTRAEIVAAVPSNPPTLAEMIQRYAAQAFLDIELKVPGLAPALAAFAEARADRIVISSFLPEVLGEVAAARPHLPLGYICDEAAQLPLWRHLPLTWVMLERRLAVPETIAELHDAGRRVMVWTVNAAAEMRRFGAMGVDAIISDDTRLLGDVFGRRGSRS